jgi:hypothetical protein
MLRTAIADFDFYQNELESAATALANAFRKSLDLQTKQDEREVNKADHDRLSRIRNEFTSDPKTITVINPVQSLVYDDDIDMRINLGSVPASYLGLAKDEQQRVLILLNGSLIPPQALALDDPFVSLDSNKLLASPISISALPGFDPAHATLIGNSTRIALPKSFNDGPMQLSRSDNALPLQTSLRSLAKGKGISSSRPVNKQSVKTSRNGTSIVTSTLTNVLPGRRMTAAKRADVEQTLSPGITIRFRADLGHLLSGTNTLVVVVVDPGGQRYQQVVSFGVAVVATAPDSRAKLPVLPGHAPSGRPASTPTGIGLHFDTKAVRDRLEKGQSFISQHSALHLQQFRRPQSKSGSSQ